jgi:hypothetical protein
MMPLFRFSRFLLWPLLLATLPAKAADTGCDYNILVLGSEAAGLDVRVACARSSDLAHLAIAEEVAAPFITRLPDQANEAHFQVDLDAFAAARNHYDSALRLGWSVLVSPSAILPVPAGPSQMLRLDVHARDGADIAIALPRISDGRFLVQSGEVEEAGEWVFGQFDRASSKAGDDLQIAVLDARVKISTPDLRQWIDDVVASNRRFWGREPVEPKLLAIIPVRDKAGLPFGRVMAAGGATILLLLGDQISREQIYEEWVLVHEFLHLGTPLLRDTGIWFNEGIATYYEPILRARAGWKSEDDVWREWLSNMPRNLPALTEMGLSNAPSRRAYYGGAIFLLLADIALRGGSQGAVGVENCLKSVLQTGADVRRRWSTEHMLSTCDQMAGQGDIMMSLARKFVFDHAPLDLAQLWQDLGVALGEDGAIRYDDSAPLAAVRRSIIWGDQRDWAPIGHYRAPSSLSSTEQ